jgi:hypothetical protein
MRPLLICLLAIAALLRPQPGRAEMEPEQFLRLAESYQSGYLRVVAVSCYQIYSSTGVIATAFSEGHIDGPQAMEALGDNGLLHSVCYSTLLDVQQNTPEEDKASRREIAKLAELLVLEDNLLRSLSDVFSYPGAEAEKKVEAARRKVEQKLDALAPDEAPVAIDKDKAGVKGKTDK